MPLTSRMRQTGMTLVELMVAMSMGLVVILAATTLFSATVGASSISARMTVLRSDLNIVANMITSDLRRAGYTANATDAFGKVACTSDYETNCPFAFKASRDITSSCVVARMDSNDNGTLDVNKDEVRGYLFNNQMVHFVTSWNGAPGCSAVNTKEAMALPDDLTVNALTFTYQSGATGTGIRSVLVSISGYNGRTPELKMTISQEVRLRNDDI
ncbi:MAG: prepilin-type N-terminal cleavage/methylation domain-containing protein [Pseudomonadota bacterium]|uniref:prepilin-type N-terminal cleavage/methylation domain-containing protein n=1 Tax=Gallaecimonas pentaromativorans TaxID=584787 RepID=UPI0009FB7317|nr:prepilin-type N-terminal cleavage/methylation domain-containing protein [Gallaecimonas pentaromativorans]MED5523941.1 prepilin-type N-terminal cleavage/methylation domain-containing protein [Pseudomonadota bacterium]